MFKAEQMTMCAISYSCYSIVVSVASQTRASPVHKLKIETQLGPAIAQLASQREEGWLTLYIVCDSVP